MDRGCGERGTEDPQTIAPDGKKLFLLDGRKQGCMFRLGQLTGDRVVVCEGFATGASIHEAAKLPVVVAFDAGNLEPVARAIRDRRAQKFAALAAYSWAVEFGYAPTAQAACPARRSPAAAQPRERPP